MANTVGINNETLRKRNRGLVLQVLTMGTCKSRIEIARLTGLSKMTVTKIISEFIQQGLICEEEQIETKGLGRNPVGIRISPEAPKIIGVYVFREVFTALLCDLQLNVLKRASIILNEENAKNPEKLLYEIVDEIMPEDRNVMGIGIGSIGQVDLKKGMLLAPTDFFGIKNLPLVKLLEDRYHLPTFLDSQYNCAALVEKYYGAAKEYQDFLFLGIANGIGSGVMSDGEILRNRNGFTSELGHASINWKGELCSCGNRGCLEMYAGTKIIETKLNAITGKKQSFRDYCEEVEKTGDPLIDETLKEMVRALTTGIFSYVNSMFPQAIILGHDSVFLPDRYVSMLEEEINKTSLISPDHHIDVLKSAFGNETQVLGCACCVLEKMFGGEFV